MEIKKEYNPEEYWPKRYKEKGGKRTVGVFDWSDEEYDKRTAETMTCLTALIEAETVEKGGIVIDYGCGIARMLPFIIDVFLPDMYIGYDIVDSVIESNVFKFADAGIRFRTLNPDIEETGVTNVFSSFVLQHIVDRVYLKNRIKNIYNCLKPGGRFVFFELSGFQKRGYHQEIREEQYYIDICIDCGFKDCRVLGGDAAHYLFIATK